MGVAATGATDLTVTIGALVAAIGAAEGEVVGDVDFGGECGITGVEDGTNEGEVVGVVDFGG